MVWRGSTLAETLLGIETEYIGRRLPAGVGSTLAETLLGIETRWLSLLGAKCNRIEFHFG